ncbi:MAG TPA: DUF1634 domain-containing protein [Bryobacteraceae bacterium]
MERTIGLLLRVGVISSSAIVLLGAICFLHRHSHEPASFHTFQAAAAVYRSIGGTAVAAMQFDCRAVIQLGLLFLIATPIVRVGFSLVAFGVERDWIYVALTSVVLAILVSSLLLER